ncbi:hypothetical protein J6590_036588 [Homalodisca vitripennis]|nr:hypothetical protein J6590_036588 [Homalodisca vitripennis]
MIPNDKQLDAKAGCDISGSNDRQYLDSVIFIGAIDDHKGGYVASGTGAKLRGVPTVVSGSFST